MVFDIIMVQFYEEEVEDNIVVIKINDSRRVCKILFDIIIYLLQSF